MRFKIDSARYILFVIGVIVSFTFFLSLNMSRRQEMETLGQIAYRNYLESNLYSMSAGYFQWDEFKSSVENEDEVFINNSFSDILDEFPFITSIQLSEGYVEGFFEVSKIQNIIYSRFSIYDSDAVDKLEKIVVVEVDPEVILTTLYDNDTFYEIGQSDGEHQVNLIINEPLLNWGHFISIFMIGILFRVSGAFIYKQTIRNHYQLDGLKSILNLLSKKDFYTADHSEEVAELAISIARRLEFPRNYVAKLYAAGILHDIGKVGINDAILNKKGKLTQEEFAMIKEHPQLGYEIVSGFTGLEEVAIIVRQHHEKLDGTGYPNGLMKGEISSLAQILTVADIYSAVRSDRPYRAAFSEKEAFVLLREMPINQEVVDALENIVLEDD